MTRYTKLLSACVAAMLGLSAPFASTLAEETANPVTTPSERQATLQQSTPETRQQQYLQRAQQAQTWQGMTPDQRHQAYQESAEQVQAQAQAKAQAAQQRAQTWSQMSPEERQQLIASKTQTIQGNMQNRRQRMQGMMQQRSGYGYSGWAGRR